MSNGGQSSLNIKRVRVQMAAPSVAMGRSHITPIPQYLRTCAHLLNISLNFGISAINFASAGNFLADSQSVESIFTVQWAQRQSEYNFDISDNSLKKLVIILLSRNL